MNVNYKWSSKTLCTIYRNRIKSKPKLETIHLLFGSFKFLTQTCILNSKNNKINAVLRRDLNFRSNSKYTINVSGHIIGLEFSIWQSIIFWSLCRRYLTDTLPMVLLYWSFSSYRGAVLSKISPKMTIFRRLLPAGRKFLCSPIYLQVHCKK